MIPLEICVDSFDSAVAAEQGGAQRVELCSALSEGGLSPSIGFIRAIRRRLQIGVHVMIRPRAGPFLYSADECAIMREDIRVAAEAGADGVVLGMLTASGDIDVDRTRDLVELAHPMNVTFHRAFDSARDLDAALEAVIRTGARRILTSGGALTAALGQHRLKRLVAAASGRVELMAGGGVRAENLPALLHSIGVSGAERFAVHSSSLRPKARSSAGQPIGNGFTDEFRNVVHVADVLALRQAIDHATVAGGV